MSQIEQKKGEAGEVLEDLRGEFARRVERAGTIEEVSGETVDRDRPQDYWSYSDAELENELWSRLPELDRAMLDMGTDIDVLSGKPIPPRPGLAGKIKGSLKNILRRLTLPFIRISLEKQDRLNRKALENQDRLNRRFKHLQFIQFLAIKQMRQRLQRLEAENRELQSRVATLETEAPPAAKIPGHE